MMNYILYGTSACHLCEEAEAMIAKLSSASLSIEKIDIAEDDHLIALYGVKIPLLKSLQTNHELGWPFDITTLQQFLSTH